MANLTQQRTRQPRFLLFSFMSEGAVVVAVIENFLKRIFFGP